MRIIAIDYPSSLTQFTGSIETLTSRAQRFISELKAAHVGRRPVVFICHSLGGLLAKRMLLDDDNLRLKTVGLLFMATPHRGSPVATNYARFAVRPAHDVILLHYQNLINKKLHEDFLRVCGTIPIISSVAETEEAPLVMYHKGVIVPSESAFFEFGPLYHIHDVHHNVCKPSNRNDIVYGVILQFVNDVIHHLKTVKSR